ncbi:hypothetical protein B0A52_02016 [Exophiala mesophila]|uniref:Alpha-1,2-mannosyltransferase n=1 Tax=Exophiala mesophila TaxID=212818 RepID=A0A438NER1_EXOME|nr:hypothetical protein B0A52_02016 [Exophiala mesophila]
MLLPRSIRQWHRRKTTSTIFQLLAFFFLLLLVQIYTHSSPVKVKSHTPTTSPPGANRPPHPFLKQQAAFWRDLYLIVLNNDPNCDHPPDPVLPHKLDVPYDPAHNHPRPDVLWLNPADVKRLTEAHSTFVADLKRNPPALVYEPGTRGLVMTAGYSQLPVLVVSIRMLRRTWSLLPVQVFLADESEYDDDICDNVLPTLNAKCLLLSDVFHTANSGVAIDRYQFKVMAILFSSFEQVLLLDSDSFPLHDPEQLFEQEPFNRTGMVVWPDFWFPSESPYYFEIAKISPVPNLTDRPSVESGELLYSKSKHALSIMLATYYNYWGPSYYYPLLSQGAPGQGDKETFAWAAAALGFPFYAVREPVAALGRSDSNGNYIGSAMAQHDPIHDYKASIRTQQQQQQPPTSDEKSKDELGDIVKASARLRPFFIHANVPKFDPSTIFQHQSTGFAGEVISSGGPTTDSNGTSVRCWMSREKAIAHFGFDVEYRFWEEIKGTACEYEHRFGCWKDKQGICDRVTQYWRDVFESVSQVS